jgi:hypothetical protein
MFPYNAMDARRGDQRHSHECRRSSICFTGELTMSVKKRREWKNTKSDIPDDVAISDTQLDALIDGVERFKGDIRKYEQPPKKKVPLVIRKVRK